jgi:hypothetical protein
MPGLRRGISITGDVNGDGAPDKTYLAVDGRGAPGCRFFVVVMARREVIATPIRHPSVLRAAPYGVEFVLKQLRLNGLAAIDRTPGGEILIDVEHGAATRYVTVYTWHGRRLGRVRVAGSSPVKDAFPYRGSLAATNAVDCSGGVASGIIVTSERSYLPETRTYDETRRYYRASGFRFLPTVVPVGMRSVPRISGRPFPRCRIS